MAVRPTGRPAPQAPRRTNGGVAPDGGGDQALKEAVKAALMEVLPQLLGGGQGQRLPGPGQGQNVNTFA